MNFFSTDISMHLKKRSVEGALCVEIEVYSDISCETTWYVIDYYNLFGRLHTILLHLDVSITNEKIPDLGFFIGDRNINVQQNGMESPKKIINSALDCPPPRGGGGRLWLPHA